MSTEQKTKLKNHTLTRFWGGEDGRCLQITTLNFKPSDINREGLFIQVNEKEAEILMKDLRNFIVGSMNGGYDAHLNE